MKTTFFLFLSCFILTSNGQSHYFYPTGHCLKKICEQIVTGRHLPYSRILQIIHKREYLNVIHINSSKELEKRQKRQADHTEIISHGLNNPIMVGIPLVILSAMFIASLRRHKPKEPEVETVIIPAEPVIEKIPPLIPPHLPKPGQPGGGYIPDPHHHHKVLSLVPYGLIPVAVFPAFFHLFGDSDQSSPSECVIFAEAEPPPKVVYHHYGDYKSRRKRAKRQYYHHYVPPPVPLPPPPPLLPPPIVHHEIYYGFRCVVTVIDKKVCNSTYQCDKVKNYEAVYGHGYFFQDDNMGLHPHHYGRIKTPSYPLYYGQRLSKRSVVQEFLADEIPQCRIEDTPHASDCDDQA